jgi:hypothetical protein
MWFMFPTAGQLHHDMLYLYQSGRRNCNWHAHTYSDWAQRTVHSHSRFHLVLRKCCCVLFAMPQSE